jgi:hypothetical protein
MQAIKFASLIALTVAMGSGVALAQTAPAAPTAAPAAADAPPDMSHAPRVEKYAREFLKGWEKDAKLQAAIKASTNDTKKLGYDEVQIRDLEWQLARTKGKDDEKSVSARKKITEQLAGLDSKSADEHMAAGEKTIATIRGSATSKFLQTELEKAKPKDAVVEVFVMDGWGWNVGQTGGTSDFYQGDEGKWQKPFTGEGAKAIEVLPVVEEDGVKSALFRFVLNCEAQGS